VRRHTLFLLQGREVQVATVDSMRGWSKDGLLHRVSFLDLDELNPQVRAQDLEHFILEDGEISVPVPLLDWLVAHNCDVVRLVTLHTAETRGAEADGVRKAEQVRADLMQWLGERQRLVTLACFLVDPESSGFEEASALPTWAANLVISPTDQALPSGAAAPVLSVRPDGSHNPVFADVASQNLCTIGGAWRFMDEGPLDEARPDSQGAGVRVLRSFVRCVDLEDPTSLVTGNALERASGISGGWPVPAQGMVPAIPPGAFSEDAAKQLGDRHKSVIDVVELTAAVARERKTVKLWAALKMFFSFLARGVINAPRMAYDAAVAAASTAASNMTTYMIFGQSSEYEVKVGRPRLRPTADTEALQQAVEAAARIADPTTAFMPPATRDLWQEYVRVGVALVDGSAMPPNHLRPQIGDARAVLTDPADVVVRTDYKRLTVSGRALGQPTDVVLDAGDPLKVILTQDSLAARLQALASTDPTMGEASPPDSRSAPPPPHRSVPPSPADDGQPPTTPADTRRSSTESSETGNKDSNGDAERARRVREMKDIQQAVAAIDEWVAGTHQPYAWRVGHRLARALATAQTHLLLAANQLQQMQRTTFNGGAVHARRIWTPLGLGLTAAVALVVVGFLDWLPWDRVAIYAVLAVIVGFALGFALFLRDLRKRFRLLHAYESGIDQQNEATRAFRHYALEVLRLNSVYWQYLQWTPVLATLMHDPFSGQAAEPEKPAPTFIANAPRSTRSATARPDPARLEALTNEARRRIFTPGWAARAWEAGSVYLLEAFRQRQALDDSLDPFDENLRRRTGALENLRDGFLAGAHGRACRKEPESAVSQLITARPLGSLTTEVLVDGAVPYPDPAAPSDADPAEGLFQEILPGTQVSTFAPFLWKSFGLSAPVDVRRSIVATLPGERPPAPEGTTYLDTVPVPHDGQLLFAAVRVDLSEPCHASDLVVFDSRAQPDATGTRQPVPQPGGGD
jgi:hypothetical protein